MFNMFTSKSKWVKVLGVKTEYYKMNSVVITDLILFSRKLLSVSIWCFLITSSCCSEHIKWHPSWLSLLSSTRWNCPAVEPSQGSHRSRPRSAQVCEAGQAPLRACAGAVLRDPQEEHPEIQQLHLSHRVTGRPLWAPPAGVGSISIRVLVSGWEGVRMWG